LAIAGRDGTPIWQLLRVLVVMAVTAAACKAFTCGRRVRIATALSIGLLAIPIGFGVGLPHLVEIGIAPVTVAGLATSGRAGPARA
jgi:hypothetical protein